MSDKSSSPDPKEKSPSRDGDRDRDRDRDQPHKEAKRKIFITELDTKVGNGGDADWRGSLKGGVKEAMRSIRSNRNARHQEKPTL